MDVGAFQSSSNIQQVDFTFDPSTGRQIFTGFAVASDYDNAAGLYDVGSYDYSDLGLGSSGQPIFIGDSPIASSLVSSAKSTVASTPLQGAVVGAVNVGQAFWTPFRLSGLTKLIGLEDTLQQRDAWLANQKSQIFLRDSWSGAIAEGAANISATAGYTAAGGPLIARGAQKTLQFGRSIFASLAPEAYVAGGALTSTQVQNLIQSSAGRTVDVFTQLTQSPAANRILYASRDPRLANAARNATMYVGRIPADLFNRLRFEGLLRTEQTLMNGVIDEAVVFEPQAMKLINGYFQATGGDGIP